MTWDELVTLPDTTLTYSWEVRASQPEREIIGKEIQHAILTKEDQGLSPCCPPREPAPKVPDKNFREKEARDNQILYSI